MVELKLREVRTSYMASTWPSSSESQVCSKASKSMLPSLHHTASGVDIGYSDSIQFNKIGFIPRGHVFISFFIYFQLMAICLSKICSAV